MNSSSRYLDCQHFNGYKPCRPHKRAGVKCDTCTEYLPATFRILILKVGLAGEVLRCTSLLRRLRELYPTADITWVTDFPDFVPTKWVTRVLKYSWQTALRLQAEKFNLVLSLDKDFDVCALASTLKTDELRGFTLSEFGKIAPASDSATRKWSTGIWDDLMLQNRHHYPAEIYEVCGLEWRGERYILEDVAGAPRTGTRKMVGLNTGASSVWTTRLWPDEQWVALARNLIAAGYDVTLLGGPDEDQRNRRIAAETGAIYRGVGTYRQFFELVQSTDVVVTAVTMAMHVAIALEKPVVLFNNIFNKHEFHLYGKGEIIEPGLPCHGCYKPRFDANCPVRNCMELISPESVAGAVQRWVGNATA